MQGETSGARQLILFLNKKSKRNSMKQRQSTKEKNMERQEVIRDLSAEIETLTRLHIQHGLHHTKGFAIQKRRIEKLIRDHEVNLKKELDPFVLCLYRRYFE
jgi:hypothetical protein